MENYIFSLSKFYRRKLIQVMTEDIKLIPLNNNPGLIVEEIANLLISTTHYKVIHQIDLSPLIEKEQLLESNIYELERICNNNCTKHYEIRNLLAKLIESAKNLKNILEMNQSDKKSKRFSGLSSFVIHQIWKNIYKTFTDYERKEIINTLQLNKNTTNILGKLFAAQSEILLSKFASDQNSTEQLHIFLQKFKSKFNNNSRENQVTDNYHMVSENYLQLEIEINKHSNDIIFATLGTLHPLLFGNDVLETIKNQTRFKKFNAKFPLDTENLSREEIIKISSIDVFIYENNLICTIGIPLVEDTIYDLYKLYPLPRKQDEIILSFILPEKEYIALSKNKKYFTSLSQNLIQNCRMIRTTYICSNYSTIQEVKHSDICEAKIVANLPLQADNCNTKVFKSKNTYWIKLNNNIWAYSAPKSDTLFVKCRNSPTKVIIINNSGLIQLEPGCVVNSRSIQFTSNRFYSNYGQLKNYTASWLDITDSLQKIKQYRNNTLENLFTEELISYNQQETQIDLTKMGIKFSEIIQKAKDLSKYNKLEEEIQLMGERITLKFFMVGCLTPTGIFVMWKIFKCIRL